MRLPVEITVEEGCAMCKGTGIKTGTELAPGESMRFGGRSRMVRRREFCSCVEGMPYEDREDLARRYREDRDYYREEKERLDKEVAGYQQTLESILSSIAVGELMASGDNLEMMKKSLESVKVTARKKLNG